MNIVCHQNPHDVLGFLFCREDRLMLDLPVKGLASLQNVPQLLQDGSYIRLLMGVWTEEDASKRLTWLRQQPQIHAPLLAERAVEEFAANPTLETVVQVALPLLKAAEFRTMQDAKGVDDPSLADAYQLLQMAYLPELDAICEKNIGKSVEEIASIHRQDLKKWVEQKVTEVATLTLQQPLPSSRWVAQHGMNAFLGGIRLHSAVESTEHKKAFANFFITNQTLPG